MVLEARPGFPSCRKDLNDSLHCTITTQAFCHTETPRPPSSCMAVASFPLLDEPVIATVEIYYSFLVNFLSLLYSCSGFSMLVVVALYLRCFRSSNAFFLVSYPGHWSNFSRSFTLLFLGNFFVVTTFI